MKTTLLPLRFILIVSIGFAISLSVTSCGSSKKKSRYSGGYSNPYKTKPRPMTETGGTSTNDKPSTETSTTTPTENTNTEVNEMARRAAKVQKVLDTADSYMGTKHRMGGNSKSGIDCSGLVQVSYKSINVSLPRSTGTQITSGTKVAMSEVAKGDLVFFTYPGGKKVTHVGIVYQVNGSADVTFIHTSSSRGVRKDNLYSDYWKKLFITARRVL